MAEIRFYHLTRRPLEAALPVLLERCWERRWRTVVMAGSPERVEALAQHLWTWREHAFLPHGTRRDGSPHRQPIWLTEEDENPNGATVLFLTDGAESANLGLFELVCEMFDGNDPPAVTAARERWRRYRDAGHGVTYFQQDGEGRWSQKS